MKNRSMRISGLISKNAPSLHLAIELLLWHIPMVVFLLLYVSHYAASSQAIWPHWQLFLNFLLALFASRLTLKLLPLPPSLKNHCCAAVVSAAIVVLLSYYGLVLIGLEYWGHVTSWHIVRTYISQAPALADVLGVNIAILAALAVLLLILLHVVVFHLLRQRDWCQMWEGNTKMVYVCTIAAWLFTAIFVFKFIQLPPTKQGEPVSLSFYPEQVQSRVQSNMIGPNRLLEDESRNAKQSYPLVEHGQKHNVILIVVDALRSDHLHVSGYERSNTPYLSALKEQGILQGTSRIRSVCAESSCGLLALARSKPVHQLSSLDFSLHEALRMQGYRVEMILSGDHTNFYGLRQAYGQLDSYKDGSSVQGFYMNDDRLVLQELKHLSPWNGKPYFLQLHLMSVHALGKRDEKYNQYLPASSHASTKGWSQERVEKAINHYDNGVLQMDAVIQQAVQTLEEKGYMSNTLLIVTADHAEMLGEHGKFGHAREIFESSICVPLLMGRFGYNSNVSWSSNNFISQMDVAPTIMQELNLPIPASWRGMPIATIPASRLVHVQQASLAGVYQASGSHVMKYWKNSHDGQEYVFDVTQDPGEMHNLYSATEKPTLNHWRQEILPALSLSSIEQDE